MLDVGFLTGNGTTEGDREGHGAAGDAFTGRCRGSGGMSGGRMEQGSRAIDGFDGFSRLFKF